MILSKENILRSAAAAALACLLAFGTLKILGAGLTSVVSGFDEDFYLKYFYDIHNRSTKAMSESDAIRVFDIGEYTTRSETAEVIRTIAECKPTVIGLDVFMQKNDELKEESDMKVVEALASAECTIVSPCIFNENSQEWNYPFYKDSIGNDYLEYASTIAFDMFEQYETDDPRSSMNTMAYKIVNSYSKATGFHFAGFEKMAINYRNKEFFAYSRLEDIDPEDFAGKIVLIGDCKDYRDIRTTPFKIMGSNSLPGVINIGYTVNSLLCSREYCKENGFNLNRRKYNEPYKKCSTLMNLGLSYILCFLLSLVIAIFAVRDVNSFNKIKRTGFIVLSFLSVIAAEVIMVILCFAVFTSTFMKIPDILLFLTSLLFVDTSIKIVEVFNDESSAFLDI